MTMTTATITSKGQITIPLAVREKLGVTKGDRVEFVELASGQFAIVAAVEDIRALKGIVRKPGRPLSIEQMNRIVAKRGSGK
jgi:antitoxin PrlF